jgi:hypothetical protein
MIDQVQMLAALQVLKRRPTRKTAKRVAEAAEERSSSRQLSVNGQK